MPWVDAATDEKPTAIGPLGALSLNRFPRRATLLTAR
jgi:hypothetical protein